LFSLYHLIKTFIPLVFETANSSHTYHEAIANHKKLLKKLFKIGFFLTMKEHSKLGILLLLGIRDNLLPLLNDHSFKMEYLILVANILGCYYRKQGKFKRAIYHLDQALNFLTQVNKKYLFILSFNDYAAVFISLNLFQRALQFCEEGLKHLLDDNNKENQGMTNIFATICYNNMAICFDALGDKDKSKSAFAHSKDFGKKQTQNLQDKISLNYQSLKNIKHRPASSLGNNPSVKNIIGKQILNFSNQSKKQDYDTMVLDFCSLEILKIFEEDDDNFENEQNIYEKREITNKTKDPKKNFEIDVLETKGILTWDNEPTIANEFKGDEFFKSLKFYEINKTTPQHKTNHSKEIKSHSQTVKNEEKIKKIFREEFDNMDILNSKNYTHKTKTKNSSFFLDQKQSNSNILENKSFENMSSSTNLKASAFVSKSEAKKTIRQTFSEKKMNNTFKNNFIGTNFEFENMNRSQKNFTDNFIEKDKEFETMKRSSKNYVPKIKSETSGPFFNKNEKSENRKFFIEELNKKEIVSTPIENSNSKKLSSKYRDKKMKFRNIMLLHEENHKTNSFETKVLKNSDLLFQKKKTQSLSINCFPNFEMQNNKKFVEKETQIDTNLRKGRSIHINQTKENNKNNELKIDDKEKFRKEPKKLKDYNKEEIKKIKKCQSLFKKTCSKLKKLFKEKMVLKRQAATKIQKNYKIYISKKNYKLKKQNKKANFFGIIFIKISTQYYKIVIFKEEDNFIYNFIKIPEQKLDKKIIIKSNKIYGQENSYNFFIKERIKIELFEIINENYFANFQNKYTNQKRDNFIIEEKTEGEIETANFDRERLKNEEIIKRRKYSFSIFKSSFLQKVCLIQRKFRAFYRLISQGKHYQKKIFCRKIRKLDQNLYLLLECFEQNNGVFISGKAFESNKSIFLKLFVDSELIGFLKEPFNRNSIEDLVFYDTQKKSLQINEEILFKLEKKMKHQPKLPSLIPLHLIIIIQKNVRRFLTLRNYLEELKKNEKSHYVSKKYKIFLNEIAIVKIKREEIKTSQENSDDFSLKAIVYLRKKKRPPLMISKEIHNNFINIKELALILIESLIIRRSNTNDDFYLRSNDVLFHKENDIKHGAYLREPLSCYEITNIIYKNGVFDLIKNAIDLITKNWMRFKMKLILKNLSIKFRKNEKNFAGFILNDDFNKILEKFKEKKEEENIDDKLNKKENEEQNVLIIETIKEFSEEISFLIKISYSFKRKTLIIHCGSLMNEHESKEIHIPIHLFGVNEMINVETFRINYTKKILDSLYFEENKIFHSFKNLHKSFKQSIETSNENQNKLNKEVNIVLSEEKTKETIDLKNPNTKENEFSQESKKKNFAKMFDFVIKRKNFKFFIEVKYQEDTGEILINTKYFVSEWLFDTKDILLDWFFTYNSLKKKHLKQVIKESKENFSKLFIVKEKNDASSVKEIHYLVINTNESQKLFRLLKEGLEKRKAIVNLQKAWRKYITKQKYINSLNSSPKKVLFLQIKAINHKYFKLIYLFDQKLNRMKVKCLDISSRYKIDDNTFWTIEILNLSKFKNNLSQILKNSISFEFNENNLILKSSDENLIINQKNTIAPKITQIEIANKKKSEAPTIKNSIYLFSKLCFYFKNFQKRKEYLKHKEITSLKKNCPLYLKSLVLKIENNYLILNCFYQANEKKVLLNFINLNKSKLVNARYFFIYHWKTYPNRIEINQLLKSIKENLYINFIYGNVNAYLLNVEFKLVEITNKIKKREGLCEKSANLMKFISSLMLIQRTFRKKKAREMRDLKIQSVKIKKEFIKPKNGKLNHTKLMKIDDGYYRVHIYENDDGKYFINAHLLAQNKERKILKTSVEIDHSTLRNTEGKGIVQFLLKNLRIENDKLTVKISENFSNLQEKQKHNEKNKEYNSEIIDNLDEKEEAIMEKFELHPSFSPKYEEESKRVTVLDYKNLKNLRNAAIVHQEEIEGNLYNVYYQNNSQKSKIMTFSQQKTIQIDVNVDKLLTFNPNLKLNMKDSLKNMADVLTKSIKIDNQTENCFVDVKNINPDALTLKRIKFSEDNEEMLKGSEKITNKKIINLSKYQTGIPDLIKRVNENRKVILKKTKMSNGKQYLIIINYLERPLKKIELKDFLNKEELLEDYEVLFEIKATFAIKEEIKAYLQIELTLGEINFLCQLQNFENKTQKATEYKLLAHNFVEKLGIINDKFIFEIRDYLDIQKKMTLNRLSKKFKKNGKDKIIFLNLFALRKLQFFYKNKKRVKNYQTFLNENHKNRKIIGKTGYIHNDDEVILVLKELNTDDLELFALDIKSFSIKNSIYLKKDLYIKFLLNLELKPKIITIIKKYLDVTFVDDSNNKSSIHLYYDEENALKCLAKEEKIYVSKSFRGNLQKN